MLRKRMSTMLLTAGVLLLSAVSLPGCGNKAESSSAPPTPTTTATMPTLLNVEITGLLTTGQVGAALGAEVGDPQEYESGTVAHYSSADSQTTAEISLKECGRDIYDATVPLYEDAVETPNLGEAAVWSAEMKQLLVYGKGYMLSVTADIAEKDTDACLSAARQMAALILEKL